MGIFFFVGLGIATAILLVHVQLKERKFSADDWDTLVSQLQVVPLQGLEQVASEHLHPRGSQVGMEPLEMWHLIGGVEGLERMERNADILIRLASYVSRWNYTEAMIVAERMRQDSLNLRRALLSIKKQHYSKKHRIRIPFYVQQAASAYYLMTRRIIALYQTNQFILYPRLSEALQPFAHQKSTQIA